MKIRLSECKIFFDSTGIRFLYSLFLDFDCCCCDCSDCVFLKKLQLFPFQCMHRFNFSGGMVNRPCKKKKNVFLHIRASKMA